MKKLPLPLAIVVIAFCGCSTQYVIKLSNGDRITCVGKPKLQGVTYYYKDAKGKKHRVSESQVVEVGPASMVKEEEPKPPPMPTPKRRHWYFLWLA
jgi:hypothetical protein